MPSPEGEGNARSALEQAWDKCYATNKAVNKPLLAARPGLKSLLRGWATSTMFDLFGFWLLWHLAGGFEGLQTGLGMSRSSVYRRISQFRAAFGVHPDVYKFPGVAVDMEAFVREMSERQKKG